jgi:hypothetical protein
MVGQTNDRCISLEQENINLKRDFAMLSKETTSLKYWLGSVQDEVGKLAKHTAYLWWGFLIVVVLSISVLVLRFPH